MPYLRWLILCVVGASLVAPAMSAEVLWVGSDRVNRRTCPSEDCGIVGKLFYRDQVAVYERLNGWARITQFYDASCVGGRSQYVDSGRSECVTENGIANGRFAEWVSLDYLVSQQPADPAAKATDDETLVSQSDDFRLYARQFAAAAHKLISSGDCTAQEFLDEGGWVKSTKQPDAPVYFTYCGGGSDRIYLDVSTGRTFR